MITDEPAFPTSQEHGANSGCPGMTLRDYFAATALQSFLLNQKPHQTDEPATYWAQSAYEFADAMMEVRNE